jgi:ankyrin repeat protein
LIEILCDNGAKMPIEWFQLKTIILPEDFVQTMDFDIVFRINRSLIDRRLRLAAANGDLSTLFHCQYLGTDINSKNCHGSTALLCSIQHGNYFSIVHSLVSRGGTILHSNENENMSLIALAKKYNYTQITNYLSQKVNTQFLTAILNNDIKSADIFGKLRADFNCFDEQRRTALHYAVEYHGIELVSWLCDRGSIPNQDDINGNYPITEATEKGIFYISNLIN